MKRILIFLLCIIFIYPSAVFARDVNMSEEYMEDSGFYRYYLDDDYYIESSVRLDSVIDNVVRLTYNDYVNVMVYKDGEDINYNSGEIIYGDGEYTVVVKNNTDTGRINFIINTISAESIDLEDEFYNTVKFTQTYDTERKMYRENMGDFYSLYATVPNLSVANRGVRIYCDSDERASISALKDGEEIAFSSGKLYSDPGYYCINVIYDVDTSQNREDMSDIDESDLYGFSEEEMEEAEAFTPSGNELYSAVATVAEFKFYITGGTENRLNYINPPQDYEISSVLVDGKRVNIANSSFYKTESDGQYKITFKSVKADMPDYSFSYKRDRSAPTLTLEGLGEGGIAEKSLAVIKNDNSSQVEISSNGAVLEFDNDIISTDGLYKIKVTDEAGNFNTYLVNVDIPINISIIAVAAVIVAAAVAVLLYIRHIKNNIQVR